MDKAKQIQSLVQEVLKTDQVYLVGGSVRDVVLGKNPKDYDFCTPLVPDEVEDLVKEAGRHVYAIGKKFGTIGFKVPINETGVYVPVGDGTMTALAMRATQYEYVEVTTFRSEVYTSKSRKPEVKFVPSLDEDLARRDFTINSMVMKEDGQIYDPFGGRLDILARQIKTVGLPKDRIQEDPLRMLRAARFASQLDFSVDPNFVGKMRQLGFTITNVSKERWVQELDKMLMGQNPVRGLKVLMQGEVMKYILPEVWMYLQDDEAYHELVTSLDALTDNQTVDERWKMLFFGIGIPHTIKVSKDDKVTAVNHEIVRHELLQGICARLKFSNERRDYLLNKK